MKRMANFATIIAYLVMIGVLLRALLKTVTTLPTEQTYLNIAHSISDYYF